MTWTDLANFSRIVRIYSHMRFQIDAIGFSKNKKQNKHTKQKQFAVSILESLVRNILPAERNHNDLGVTLMRRRNIRALRGLMSRQGSAVKINHDKLVKKEPTSWFRSVRRTESTIAIETESIQRQMFLPIALTLRKSLLGEGRCSSCYMVPRDGVGCSEFLSS